MELSARKKKRAVNMVWTAAGRYDIDPVYLFYDNDGEPSLYPNTLEGLGYRCMKEDVLLPFLEGLACGKEPEKIRPIALLALSEAVFRRECGERPALAALRKDYAEKHLAELHAPERYEELGWERQDILRCRRILGRDVSCFDTRELALADALEAAGTAAEDEELVREVKSILRRFFFYRFMPARKSETVDFVGAGMIIVLLNRLFGTNGRTEMMTGPAPAGGSGFGKRLNRIWKHMLSETTADEDLAYIEKTFGPCILPGQQLDRAEQEYCTGYHTNSRLWYAGANSPDPDLGQELRAQQQKNLAFFRENERIYRRDIRHITEHLKHALEQQLEPDVVHNQSGKLDSRTVYRIRAMHDLAVFSREISYPTPDFTVDLILDASGSRKNSQQEIAVQAYILAQSLMNLEIPVQVTSFRSVRSYTVLQRLKDYEERTADGIFNYYAAGNNRDGLAFNAVRPLLNAAGLDKKKRILLILTDALPNDTEKAYVPGFFRRGADYDEKLAADDTREAVQSLRREGSSVSAIFWGMRMAVPNLKHIYGDAYISIHSINQLPDAVIGMLLRILSRLRDREGNP